MRTHLMIATIATALFTVTACGGDGEASGDTERFCEIGNDSSFEPTDENLDLMLSVAPGEIRDEVETVTEGLRKINELEAMDEPDPELAAEIEELATSDEWAEAYEAIDRYAADECDTVTE